MSKEETAAAPYGWTALESPTYDFGEARFGTPPNKIPSNQIGKGEDAMHSEDADPEGSYGAAKVSGGLKSSYGNTDDYKPEGGGEGPGDVGTLDLPFAHVTVENGHQNGRNYYLVHDTKEDKFYTVIPSFKENKEYRSTPKSNRTDALGDAYRVLSASLPDSALAQMRKRFPETPILSNIYD